MTDTVAVQKHSCTDASPRLYMEMRSQPPPWPFTPQVRAPLPTVEAAGSVLGLVWKEKEISPPPVIRPQNHTAGSR